MKKCCLVILLTVVSLFGYTQQPNFPTKSLLELPNTQVYTVNEMLLDVDAVSSYLTNQHPLLNQPDYSFTNIVTKKSLTGIHYTYAVSKDLVPIYAAQIRVHTDLQGKVRMIQDNIPTIPAFYTGTSDEKEHLKWVFAAGHWQWRILII